MKEERIKEMISNYKSGKASIEEERYLQQHAEHLEQHENGLFTYIRDRKISAPSDFNAKQWEIFERKQNQRKINRYSVLAVAASILVLVGFFLTTPSTNGMDLAEKQALLIEALQMTESTQEPTKTILYEDELVIIYTSN